MNLQSLLLLALIVVVAGLVLIHYVKSQKRTGGCGSCRCGSCPHCDISTRHTSS
ncbi:MAG: hypothetical protein K5945_01030 [Bacteroidaceae bacterium]|nr:hypothetical protein [Bacteroidaceae bacterium]